MKARTFFSTLAVITVLLLTIGVGSFWGITARSPFQIVAQGGKTLPAGTLFVPKQSPFVASVLTYPHQLADLWRLLAAPSRRDRIQSEMKRLESSFLAGTGLSYGDNIKPWIGEEITFALTTPDRDEDISNGRQPGYLLVLSCRDRNLAQDTLELYWQKRAIAGSNLIFEQFLGSQLISTGPEPSTADTSTDRSSFDAQASAVIGNQFVLLANSATVIKQALTTAQAKTLSLEQDFQFRAALDRLPQQRVGMIFVNLPQSLRWLGLASAPLPLTTGLGSADNLFNRGVFSVRLNRQGLVADAALLAVPGHTFDADPSQLLPDAARFLPPDTPLAAMGNNLAELGQTLSYLLSQYGVSAKRSSLPLPMATTFNGFDLSMDWLQTCYALSLIQTSEYQQDWALAVRQTPETDAALRKLDQSAQQEGISIGSLQLGQHDLVAWTKLMIADSTPAAETPLQVNTQVVGLRTQFDDYKVMSSSATAINRILQTATAADNALTSTQQWQAAVAPLNPPETGYFYIEWPRLAPSLRQQFPWFRLFETAGQPFLDHIQAVVIAGYDHTPQMKSGAISLYLSNLGTS